jgi:hypothetical protein
MHPRKQALDQIEEHIVRGDLCIAAQLDVIDRLREMGHDTGAAEAVLADFRASQQTRFECRDKLLELLYT